jgi:hypothetical protein
MRHETDHRGSTSTRPQPASENLDLEAEHDPERARRVSNALLRQSVKTNSTITVSAGGVVDLKTGDPQGKISLYVADIVGSWNTMMHNLTGAVAQFVDTVHHAQVREAAPGLMAALWGKVEPLLTRAATFVTGTPLGARFGVEAIKHIVAHGDALEQQRIQADKQAFIDEVYRTENALKQTSPFEGGQAEIVGLLEDQFIAIGENNPVPEDTWKRGDRGVVGAQAAFLKDLEHRKNEYKSHIPSQNEFTAKFLQEWVTFHHKTRKRSAMRSPFEDSTYQDGYIELQTTLHHDAYLGWFVGHGTFANAKLHCPNSAEVAHTLQQTIQPFDLDQLDVPITIELHAADTAWDHMPARWKHQRDRRVHVRNGMATGGAQDYWRWVLQEARTSTRDILAGVRKLEG